MKKCSYCGRDNADDAANCRECGTPFEDEPAQSDPAADADADADTEAPPVSEKKTLVIRIFPNHELAEIAAAKLRAHGIEASLGADDCGGMYPSLTVAEGVRLKVWEEDEAIATAVLDAKPTAEENKRIEIDAVLAAPPPPEPRPKFAWGQLIVAFCLGLLVSLFYQWRQDQSSVTHYRYTPDGKCSDAWIYRHRHLVEYMQDRNLDGQWDHWVYYEQGREVRSESDNNFDGQPDLFWKIKPDGSATMEQDTDFNGVPDVFCSYKYGIIQMSEMRPNGSPFATERNYFKNGVLTEVWRGGDRSGNFREIVKYDPFMNPISTNTPDELMSPAPAGR